MKATPRQLVSNTDRAAAVVVVVVCLSVAWLSAGKESQQTVATTMTAISTTHIKLPTVTVIALRDDKAP